MLKQKIARINLSTGDIRTGVTPPMIRQLYLGGRGIDAYLLYNIMGPGIEPLSPENVLLISAGLLVGTPVPGANRCHISGKSPLTGLVGSMHLGGFFASELRFAGYDHLIITGKSSKPVYLWINDESIEIKEASHLWGNNFYETQKLIKDEHGDNELKVIGIGLAGENLVKIASIMTGTGNTTSQTGMGAVMGAKNLKAIAVRGTHELPIEHTEKALSQYQQVNSKIRGNKLSNTLSQWGNVAYLDALNRFGLLRANNHQSNQIATKNDLNTENIKGHFRGKKSCMGCPMSCIIAYNVPWGPHQGSYQELPDFDGLAALSSICGTQDLTSTLVSIDLAMRLGIDATNVGNLIGFTMECYEKGIANRKNTDGMSLHWGNNSAVLTLIEKIARRDGFGDKLADGFGSAIEYLGKESEYYAMQVKGRPLASTDDRPIPSFALGLATSTTGADKLTSRPWIDLFELPQNVLENMYGFPCHSDFTSYQYVGKMVWHHELLNVICDSLGICRFLAHYLPIGNPGFEEFKSLIRNISGLELTTEQIQEIGERIYTTERLFNQREGKSSKDDWMPERLYLEITTQGTPETKGKKLNKDKWAQMLDEYYAQHGWDQAGNPADNTKRRLEIDEALPPFFDF